MKSVGQMVAGVIENAQLLADLERNNQQLTMLVESGLEFGATLDLDTVLSSVAERMCAATGADCCDVYALEDETLRGLVNVDQGVADDDFAGTTYRLADLALATLACESRAPVTCFDCTTDARLTEFERREWLRWDFRGSLRLPLIHRGEVVGMVSVFDRRPREFERVDLLQGLAQVAASAMVNATLYQEIDKSADRFSLVNRLSMEFSATLDLQQVLSSAARNLCSIANVPACRVYTLAGDRLVCAASISDEQVDDSRTVRRFGRDQLGIVRAAIGSRQPLALAGLDDGRLSAADRESMRAHGAKSELVVPLVAKDEAIGAVELIETRRERCFSDGRDRHRRSRLPGSGAGHRQRQPGRAPQPAQPRDRGAQCDRPEDGGEPAHGGHSSSSRAGAAAHRTLGPEQPAAVRGRGDVDAVLVAPRRPAF